jgi:hypothetical protein
VIDAATLDELLRDPECPYGLDGEAYVASLRDGRPMKHSRYISLQDLGPFVAARIGHGVDMAHLDRLMVEEIGATRVPHTIDLEGIVGRALDRLRGRKTSAPPIYEVPSSLGLGGSDRPRL